MSASGALASATLGVSGTSSFVGNVSAGNVSASGALASATLGVSGTSSFVGNVSAANVSASGVSTVGNITMTASSGIISGLSAPVADGDAANKLYVDSYVQGLDPKGSVVTIATSAVVLSGTYTLNGVVLAAEDRVLVSAQGDNTTNGIYVVAAGAWSRSADMNISAEFAGSFFFVESGTAYADTGWVCTVNKGFVLGTDAVAFTQFSAAGVYSAGNGLALSGTVFSVNEGDGLKFSDGVLHVDLVDSNPGLEFSSGELKVLLNATNPALSLSSGLSVILSGTTLAKDSDGLKVSGLPSAFEIAGSATNASVSASNLSTVTGGSATSAGNASSLLTLNNVAVWGCSADGALSIADPVYISGSNTAKKSLASRSSAIQTDGFVLGIAAAAAEANAAAKIITSGIAAGVLTSATAGTAYYLGTSGGLTTDPAAGIASGSRFIFIGIAMNATDLWVQVRDFGQKA